MATLEILGKRVEVGDEFLELTPEQQQQTVNEIAERMGHDAAPESLSAGETVMDYGRSLATGLRQGAEGLAGLPGDARELVSGGAEWVAGKLGASPETQQKVGSAVSKMTPYAFAPPTRKIQETTTRAVGEHYNPKTRIGKGFRTVGQFAPAALGGPGNIMTRIGTQVVAPAVTSEVAGQLTEGTPYEPYARLAGAVAGGLAPSVLRKVRTPGGPIDPERLRQTKVLKKAGVDLTGGQATGRESLKYKEVNLGGAKAQNWNETQLKQFTKAAFKKAGFPEAQLATTKNMDALFGRVGKEFDRLEGATAIRPNNKFIKNLQEALTDYAELMGAGNQATRPNKIVQSLVNHAQKGQIPGKAVKSIRTQITDSIRKTNDSNLQGVLIEIRDALDDAMESTLKAINSPNIGAWQKVRGQYRNLLVFEKAKLAGGEKAALGIVTPAQLASAVKVKHGKRAYVRGQGDLAELAEAGVGMMSPLPQSGTTPHRLAALGGQSTVTGTAGAAVGSLVGAPAGIPGSLAGAAIGGTAGAAIPRMAGAAMLSRPGRNYLSQVYPWQKITEPGINPLVNSAVAGLLARPTITPK